jgi:diaminopimelate decarboxylase
MKSMPTISRREFVALAAAGATVASSKELLAVTQTEAARKTPSPVSADDALENAIRKNVEIGVERLRDLQPIVAPESKTAT